MSKKRPTESDLAEDSVALSKLATSLTEVAQRFGFAKRIIPDLPLDDAEYSIVANLSGLSATLERKLKSGISAISVVEAANVLNALAQALVDTESPQRRKLLLMSQKLAESLSFGGSWVPTKGHGQTLQPAVTVYQFKVTLFGVEPAVWRRIQIWPCSLDKLHEYIQTAMGWTNSHLYRFEINGQHYGDPELLDDGFGDFDYGDSTKTALAKILPRTGEHFRFNYEYDFGDGWVHEVLFEGCPKFNPKAKYPLCLEGARACPPEDCGGIGGYEDFLEAIGNPKHGDHKRMRQWIGGRFDSAAFDAKKATRAMLKGLPDWRRME
ncbi:MAG: plasmid pRiA4b ORF-3 family protein [Planctomycetaceae bacterium]|nr:plasmid pRiA4b ORF-3 family protein [Planctomycetaceae bacterium]